MKPRHLVTALLLLVCISLFGQQPKTAPMQKQTQKAPSEVISNHQEELFLQLQSENDAMRKQLVKMENDIELYRRDVREETTRMNTYLNHLLVLLSIIMTILGVAIPLILNFRNERSMEKMLEDVKKQADSAEKQATEAQRAVKDIEELKKHIETIEEKVNKDTLAAKEAAHEAKVSQLFAQALSETDASNAIELYTQAISLMPNFSEAYNNRGNLKDDLGDKDGAMKDYDKAIDLDPKDATAYYNRGILKDDLGDKDGAMKDFDKAIDLDPKNATAYNNMADLLISMNQLDGALANINRAIQLDSNSFVYFVTRGEIYLAMNNPEKAILDFNHALSINDGIKKAYENRAKCNRKIAETEQDSTKKKSLIAQAEADERKARSLE